LLHRGSVFQALASMRQPRQYRDKDGIFAGPNYPLRVRGNPGFHQHRITHQGQQ